MYCRFSKVFKMCFFLRLWRNFINRLYFFILCRSPFCILRLFFRENVSHWSAWSKTEQIYEKVFAHLVTGYVQIVPRVFGCWITRSKHALLSQSKTENDVEVSLDDIILHLFFYGMNPIFFHHYLSYSCMSKLLSLSRYSVSIDVFQ